MKLFIALISIFLLNFAYAKNLEQIIADKKIRVGVLENYLPFSKKEANGNFRGFEIDLAKKITEHIFKDQLFDIEFKAIRFTERVPFLQNDDVDIVVALFPTTDEAKKFVDFSMPYLTINSAILAKTTSDSISVNSLDDKKIALQENTIAESFLIKKGCKKSNFVYIKWFKDCYAAVKNNDADVCVGDNIALLGYPLIDDSVEIKQNNIGQYVFISVGVAKGNKELLNSINETLIDLNKNGYFNDAYKNTFDVFYKGTADKKYFLLDDIYNSLL